MLNLPDIINKIHCIDNLPFLRQIPSDSIDLLATDPPYGYSFMGKDWDKALPPISVWKECLRILKPGAFAFIMSSPRQDVLSQMIVRIDQAGFETGFTSIYWAYACISEDTCILTDKGIKNIDEIKIGDIIYSLDLESNKLIKSPIKNKFIYNHSGKMINIKNQNTNQLLTLNHKILCKNRYRINELNSNGYRKRVFENEWKYVEAQHIDIGGGLKIPISGVYEGNKSIGKNLASLLGWIISEGHFFNSGGSNDIRIYQSSVNMSHVDEIRNLLINLNIPYHEYKYTKKYEDKKIVINGIKKKIKKIGTYDSYCFMFSGEWNNKIRNLIPDKKPTFDLLNLIYDERMELYESLIKGDGSRRKKKEKYKHTTDRFWQKDYFTIKWFEMLLITLGWQSKIYKSKRTDNYSIQVKKQSTTEFQRHTYKPQIIDYNGRVWCIETEKGNFVSYRDRGFFITGNSGFPKSMNIGKAIDKKLGLEREIIGQKKLNIKDKKIYTPNTYDGIQGTSTFERNPSMNMITAPTSPEAKLLDGSYSGFSPKPAVEIIIVAMKPLSEETYMNQAMKNSHGVTWLDNCRIPYQSDEDKEGAIYGNDTKVEHTEQKHGFKPKGKHILASDVGRFPANLLVSDDILNDGNITKTTPHRCKKTHNEGGRSGIFNASEDEAYTDINDSGSFSRYFDLDKWFEEKLKKLPPEVQKVYPFLIIPKASVSERNEGCENLDEHIKPIATVNNRKCKVCGKQQISGSPCKCSNPEWEIIVRDRETITKNFHPTVKPIKLFSYLITLGSRENDIILDPYIGSGTSAISSLMLERKFIGIDNDVDYCKIANERIKILLNYKEGKEAFENSVSDEPFKLKIKEETKMDEDMFL